MSVKKVSCYTLLELLIVCSIIALLGTGVAVAYSNILAQSKDLIVKQEMDNIKKAFNRFYSDVQPDSEKLQLLTRYGLEPLIKIRRDGSATAWFEEYDPERQRGWNGPYLDAATFNFKVMIEEKEYPVKINTSSGFQAFVKSTAIIPDPVQCDAYGGYYRIVRSDGKSFKSNDAVTKLALIFTGPDKEFDAKPNYFTEKDSEAKNKFKGDDVVLELLNPGV